MDTMSHETDATNEPRTAHRTEGFPVQHQEQPGDTSETTPTPDHGESSYEGHGRLAGLSALITGGDSGIGRATAIAYAREGANVAITYQPEEQEDAASTVALIEDAGVRGLSIGGDLRTEDFCREVVESTVREFGGLDVLVLNAGYQQYRESLVSIPTDELARVFETNLLGTIWTAQAAIPHLKPGSSIIVTASIQAFNPSPDLIDYAMTKAAQVAFVRALAEQLGPDGIRVNAVAPGPIWTPLIPATGWTDKLTKFGQDTPLGRAGQPAELAPAFVFLADPASSYVSGGVVPVTGGKPL